MKTESETPLAVEAQRLDEAAEWMLLLREEHEGNPTLTRWIHWCESDARNQEAFDRVQALWSDMGGLAAEVRNGELVSLKSARDRCAPVGIRSAGIPQGTGLRTCAERERVLALVTSVFATLFAQVRAVVGLRTRLIGAAVAVLGTAALVWNVLPELGWLPIHNNTVVTTHAPTRRVWLPDGSSVDLAAKSLVSVHYTDAVRTLDLEGGEAYFSVRQEKDRPFVVAAGTVRVRAIGTAFNVRRTGVRIVVTVAQGQVDICDVHATSSMQPIRVITGQRVACDPQTEHPSLAVANTAAALAWREGRLEYTNEPLEAVIDDINRYSKQPVVIVDDNARRLRFSGTVLVDYTEDWVHALPGEFPVQVRRQNGVDLIQSSE